MARVFWRTTLLVCFALLLPGCGSKEAAGPIDGRALAAVHCARCHNVPTPGQLPREEWPYLLAWMGNYLGYKEQIPIHPLLVIKPFVPPKPLVDRAQFEAICNYFLTQSAMDYQRTPPAPEPPVSTLFEVQTQAVSATIISLVAIDPVDHSLVVGSSEPPALQLLNRGAIAALKVSSEPISYERLGERRRLALIGHLGHDSRLGQVIDFNASEARPETLVSGHPRIATHRTADVDGDGQADLLVCGFGDYPTGRVAIWWGGAGGKAGQEQVLFTESGAVWADVADLDGDGKPDVIVTIANNHPRVLAFINQGGRRFEMHTLVERPVGWGYNRCLLVDWDGDGRPDLVELAGNNLELRGRPIKAQHGVRILRNDGELKFREVLFEPLPGAIDVAAGDFDGDGRVDLAVTAFYPDWRQEHPTTLLLLMHRADGTVERAGIDPQFWNRWMRIGVGDVDGDGFPDLILGAAEVPAGIPMEQVGRCRELLKGKASVVVLRNRGRGVLNDKVR